MVKVLNISKSTINVEKGSCKAGGEIEVNNSEFTFLFSQGFIEHAKVNTVPVEKPAPKPVVKKTNG